MLTTTDLYHLDQACLVITRAFGGQCPYLVGSARISLGDKETTQQPRDVDVRLMLDADEFAAACPTKERWELLCLTIGVYLSQRTGLPIDFQIQRTDIANQRYDQPRNPLGLIRGGRVFAGGGDGTPEWSDGNRDAVASETEK
jgi:hypothetical protein